MADRAHSRNTRPEPLAKRFRGQSAEALGCQSSALPSLRGHASRPILFGAPSPFEVTGANTSALTERLLPELLRRLLHAEAQTCGLPEYDIHVPSNIHAANGGEDGRIEWEAARDRTPFLPSRLNLFQLKAGKIRRPLRLGRS